ncbi:MAG: TIGR00303 family protein [Ignisphaera sp.]
MVKGIRVLQGSLDSISAFQSSSIALYVIGSTMTSTIPNISLAGSMSIATLFTPALDVEYLYFGKPVSIDIIPTTPTGIPTPAIITRTALQLSQTPFMVIDAGSYIKPRIPLISLSSSCVGGRIDREDALSHGTSRKIFDEATLVGRAMGSIASVVLIGESIPGGTTTALSILQGLGYNAYNIISSSAKENPLNIKKAVVEEALKRLGQSEDPFKINDVIGDPVHIAIAGLALGALKSRATVILAGGTQMLAALALMKAIDPRFDEQRLVLATTKWIYSDRGAEITRFIKMVVPNITFAYVELDFSDAPFNGLRAYEDGFVKEGVGAGGTSLLAILKGVDVNELKHAVYREYERIVKVV